MKSFLCKLNCFFETFGRARAASILARQGLHEQAKSLMDEEKCKC